MTLIPNILEIKILSESFITPSGSKAPQTAKLFLQQEFQGEKVITLGYFPQEVIFERIKKQEPICLDYCYIDHLSLAEYRQQNGLDKKQSVVLADFSARNAIFHPHQTIDLSYTCLPEGNFLMDHALFLKGSFSLHAIEIGKGNISFADNVLNISKLDLSNANLGEGNMSFKNAIFFNGFKDFQYCHFGNGDIIFTNTDFGDGDVSFINSTFGQCDVSFKVARFGTGKVDFHYAHFAGGDISFERTDFGSGFVDFRKVEWENNRINFNRSIIGLGGISFEESELKNGKFSYKKASLGDGNLAFSNAVFNSIDVTFEGTNFGNCSLNFRGSFFNSLSLKTCHIDKYADLRVSEAVYLDLSDTIIRDIMDIKPIKDEVNIQTANFEGMRLIGRIYIGWHENKVISMIAGQKETDLSGKAEQFRTLKQNFNETGQYSDEDNAYVYFKRYESLDRLDKQLKENPWRGVVAYPEYAFKWLVFDKIGLYATSPLRVLVSIVFIYVFFALFLYLGQVSDLGNITSAVGNPDHLSALSQSFYHSAITFFTIGYGDTYPQGLDRIISALEGFIGVFMMSYFTVAFVRKILR